MNMLKSMAAAKELGVSYHQLFGLLRSNKVNPPLKDSSGDYLWTEEDLKTAREQLDRMKGCQTPPKAVLT